jgi:protoporphyrin/coproporphyrin ferrochelatase
VGPVGEMGNTFRRLGIVLFQLGGPDTLDAIEPFLFNLFCDPDIIDFPFARIGRRPLAKLISTTRAKKVQHHYSVIGGGSPIRRFTEAQGRALERKLAEFGFDATCVVAMRYWHPFTREAIAQLQAVHPDEIVLLPMYPQYSTTTTGSSLNEWNRLFTPNGAPIHCVQDFYRNPTYLDAVVGKVEEALARFPRPSAVELVFSAHSVPIAVIQKGDPYQRQIEETVSLVMERGGWANRHRLCYQSKVGASKWLQPTLRGTLRDLGEQGAKQVCVVPISFVSDHVETLGEIDHEARQQAQQLGITQFEMSAGLNDSPKFIAALADVVMAAAGLDRARHHAGLVAAD